MKTLVKISLITVAVVLVFFAACKKEAGFEGKKTIKGTVTLKSGGSAVAGAIVYIAFDTKEATGTFNFSTITDASGSYSFYNLSKGDYFIDATYTDDKGFRFESGGAAVEILNKKKKVDITVDLTLE